MLDTGLLIDALLRRGHTVGHCFKTPENAGGYQMEVDGTLMTLDQVRNLMEQDDAAGRGPKMPRVRQIRSRRTTGFPPPAAGV